MKRSVAEEFKIFEKVYNYLMENCLYGYGKSGRFDLSVDFLRD